MMTKNSKRKSKKLLALLFAGCMLSATLGGLAACGDKSSSKKDVDDSEVTVTEKDDGRISNAKFEIFDDNDGKNLIVTSPNGWTRSAGTSGSNTATSSNAASGIVDTANWETYTATSSLPHETLAEAEANWENLKVRDKLEFLFNWKKADSDNNVKDLSFYDADDDIFNYNVDFEDLPSCENPSTRLGENAGEDTSLLMIHNYLSKDNWGTAQKYTSASTITLQPGLSAEVSVWVKTADLTYANTAGESQPAIKDRGAYIGITNSVAGEALDQVQVKNIIANDWTEYKFFLTASEYADTTFTLVLGLGQGGGNKWEYVSGYAFFDDISCTVKRTEDFAFNTANKTVFVSDDAESKLVLADEMPTVKTLHVDFRTTSHGASWNILGFDVAQTTEKKDGQVFVSNIPTSEHDFFGTFKASELKTKAEANTNPFLTAAYNKDFANYPFEDDADILTLFSASGAPYTAKQDQASPLNLSHEQRVGLSFWLKTSDLSGGFTGAGIKLHITDEHGNTTTQELFLSQNTSSPVKVEADGENGEKNEDVFDGWQQYFLFFENNTEEKQSMRLEFTYGPTAIATAKKTDYREGYATFANLKLVFLEEDEFESLSEGTYSKIITIGEEKTSFSKFDEAAGVPTDAIEKGFANPSNYDGVKGGSKYVLWNGDPCEKNAYEYAGLLNKDHLNAYADLLPAGSAHSVTDILDGATQPLVIYNNEKQSYGYIGQMQTIEAKNTATIGIKIKASAGAIANVYLMEKTDAGYTNTLNIETPKYVYWYDEDGNICAKDPTKSGFDKKRDIAFKRNARGVFEANPLWSGYIASEMDGKYFANLQNYEKDPATGNLLVADGGVKYNYDSSVWKHEGNNGIAFYAQDKDTAQYYLTAAKKDRVYDLASLSNVADFARYKDNQKSGELSMQVVGSANGEWVECFFYIQAGNEAKSYRLEVWSGSRDGAEEGKSEADSFVAFELISWSKDFTDLKNQKLEAAREAFRKQKEAENKDYVYNEDDFRAAYEELAYSAFSFFDSAKFLRYDESLDKEGVGNSYDEHDATIFKEGLVYFQYFDQVNHQYSTFVDYSFVEAEVSADSSVETDDDHDHDHETAAQDNGMNIWLLISSLALAGVLLLAVVSLIVQKIVRKHRKLHGKNVKVKAPKAKKEKFVKAEQPEDKKDEKDPYND